MTPDTPPRTSPDLQRIDRILDGAMDLEGTDRRRYLEEQCGDDPELRDWVERLLAASETAGVIHEGGALSHSLIEELEGSETSDLPRRLSRYELLEVIGRGGMGVVYRARRADGAFEREVAVKLLRTGLDIASADASRRFERERRLLATLDHPNVARLLDGGVTDEGESFLVVELVNGRSITDFCAEAELPIEARVRMLIALCDAVQAAHQRLIVHRDIKPSNILVTDDGTPKLLDFGIARLMEGAADQTALTREQQRVMTLQYASPEQYQGLPVTVASDVYQLGLVAYEILTGTRPYSLSETSPAEAERLITRDDPPAPSRATGNPASRQRLRGDLDQIVLEALRKEVDRRYPTVDAFRDDLQRFLDGLPVSARPSSWSYRTRKFIGRHTVPVAVAAISALALVAAGLVFTVQLIQERDRTAVAAELAEQRRERAELASEEAEQVQRFVIDLFGGVHPDTAPGTSVTVLDLLDQGRSEIDDKFSDLPMVRARMLSVLGQLYRIRAQTGVARELQIEAAQLMEEALASPPPSGQDTAGENAAEQSRIRLRQSVIARERGRIELQIGRPLDAIPHLEEAVRLAQSGGSSSSEEFALALQGLGEAQIQTNQIAPGVETLRRADTLLGAHDLGAKTTIAVRRMIGEGLLTLGRLDEAYAIQSEVLDLARREAPGSIQLAGVLDGLAKVQRRRGETAEALERTQEAVSILERVLAPGHPVLLSSQSNLAGALTSDGRLEEAQSILEHVLEESRARKLSNVEQRVSSQLGLLLAERLGDPAQGLRHLRRALELTRSAHPDGSYDVAIAESNLASALRRLGRLDEAESMLQRALSTAEGVLGVDHIFCSYPLLGLATVEAMRQNHAAAARFAERSFAIRNAQLPVDAPDRQYALAYWVAALEELGQTEEAARIRGYENRSSVQN